MLSDSCLGVFRVAKIPTLKMLKVVIISDLRVALRVSNIGKLFSGLDSSAFWEWGGVQHTLSSKRDLSSTILHKSLPTCF